MSGNLISTFKSIYDKSGLPAAIADEKLHVIWKNKISGSVFSDSSSLLDIFGGKIPDTGLVNTISGSDLCSFNVLKAEDRVENRLYYIVELVRSERIINILNTPAIRDYISYLCAKIRDAAGTVSNSTDEIYDAVSCGIFNGEDITERLNIIDESIMSITKEIVQPDQFYFLMDMNEKEATLSLDNEMQHAVNSARASLGKIVEVTYNCDKNIFFRMDRSTFETVIAGMAAKCCGMEFLPETLVFSAKRIRDGRAEVSVMSVSSECRNNNIRSNAVYGADLRGINSDLFFDYICEILCSRFGAVFTKAEMPNGFLFKMEFDVISQGVPSIAMTSAEYAIGRGRFGIMPLMLADFPALKRYKLYDIDGEEEKTKTADDKAGSPEI